jgi:hypothetical protein
MNKILKNRFFFVLKIAVTIVILYFIFRRIDINQLKSSFSEISWVTILAILLTAAIKIFIEILNWASYLKINPQYESNTKEIIRSHMIGHSLRFLLPGGHAVWAKMYFVNNKKILSVMSMGLERFFHIWINLLFAAFASIFYFRKLNITIPVTAFVVVLCFPLIIYLFKNLKSADKLDIYFRKYLRTLPRIAFFQSLYMALTIFQYFILLNNFLPFHIFSAIISIPLILFANLIPITYAGLGLREKFAIGVLAKYQIGSEIAVAVALTVFLFNSVLPALAGLFFFINQKRKQKSNKENQA